MKQAISKTVRISAIAATLLLGATVAHAQDAYTGDTGHYLQVPQGAVASTTTTRPTFNGQGMGTGQLQTSYRQPAAPLTVTTTPASASMLPQGYTAPQAQAAAPVAMPMASTTTVMPAAQPVRIQTASIPSSQPSVESLAAMEPAAGSAFDSSTNVKVAPSCGSPGNHRQHKGMNTSTTVGSACFD